MNIIEKEANRFIKSNFNDIRNNSLEKLKSALTDKLYNFTRDRDKLDFLKISRSIIITDKEEHIKKCQKPECKYPESKDLQIFVIEQEVDDINKYYSYEPKDSDIFSVSEESNLHTKLNDIFEMLEKQGLSQEIIYNEIEELKNHFNLGKKTWFQLLKGKLVELTVEKILDETIVKEIYNNLSVGYTDVMKSLNS